MQEVEVRRHFAALRERVIEEVLDGEPPKRSFPDVRA